MPATLRFVADTKDTNKMPGSPRTPTKLLPMGTIGNPFAWMSSQKTHQFFGLGLLDQQSEMSDTCFTPKNLQ